MNNLKSYYNRYRFFILPVGVSLTGVVIITMVVFPQLSAYLQTRGEIAQMTQRNSLVLAKAESLESINQDEYAENLELALSALPEDQSIPEALIAIQNVVSQSSMSLEGVRVLGISQQAGGSSYQLAITVLGTLNSLKDLLSNINDSPRVFKVESISAQLLGLGVESEINLTVYFDPNIAMPAGLEQPVPKLSEEDEKLIAKIRSSAQLYQPPAQSLDFGKQDPFE